MFKKLTTENFILKAKEVHNNKYNYSITEYINKRTKVCIICPKHGEFWQVAGEHVRGNGCKKCSDDRKRSSLKIFILKAKEVHNNKYNYSKVNYINNHTKVCIICPEHGGFWQTPNKHLTGRGCCQCGGSYPLTKKLFVEMSIRKHGRLYNYDKVNYKNYKEKVCIICQKHGEFWQSVNSHLNGNGCPKCKLSKGERTIEQWLNEHNIKFIPQHRFEDCRNKKPLPFDFYLPDYNTCIEYDGEQHFKPMGFGSDNGKQNFKRTQKNDKIKNDFCENNNVKILRIKYYENINKKLEILCELVF